MSISSELLARLRRFFSVFEAEPQDAAVFRARQLQAMLRLTPAAMGVNVVNAATVCAVSWNQAPAAFLLAWMGVITLLSALGLRGWQRSRRQPRRTASPRAIRRAVLHASLLGGAWAALPAGLFAALGPGTQFIVGVVITGMLCGGGFALASVPAAATGWVTVLGLGSAVAMWRADSAVADGVVGMLILYCSIVVYSVWTTAKTFGARLVAEARAERQDRVIGRLLRDAGDEAPGHAVDPGTGVDDGADGFETPPTPGRAGRPAPAPGLLDLERLREQMQAALDAAEGAATPLVLVMLGLHGYRPLHDTRGPIAGQGLPDAVGQRLLAAMRPGDTVARLAGGEFAVLLRGHGGREVAQALAQRLLSVLEQPAEDGSQGAPATLRASAGIALAPWDGADADTLLNHADIALCAARRAGAGHCCFFAPEMPGKDQRRSALEKALRGVAGRGELRLEYQPQVEALDGRVRGFEALLRWSSPGHGAVSPAEFVPIAEAAGLMPRIGEWVLREACAQARQWPDAVRLSVNVSATQLAEPGFAAQVAAAAQGLRPERIELEVTEAALIADVDAAVQALTELRGHGFRIALDDFGTGYSALGYLRRFRFDTLKIDRGFVRDLATDAEARAIVDTILAMARAMRMSAIAEGVETAEQAQMLRERGCAALQGFMISRPLPPQAAAAFLAAHEGTVEPPRPAP